MKTGLPYPEEEIINMAFCHIDDLDCNFELEGLDFQIISLEVFGSRKQGTHREDSDLDIKIIYKGLSREDDLLNALNREENKLYFDSIEVDFS